MGLDYEGFFVDCHLWFLEGDYFRLQLIEGIFLRYSDDVVDNFLYDFRHLDYLWD